MINLTDAERSKFSSWLRQEAQTNKDLIVQMKAALTPDAVINRYKALSTAMTIVALELEETETQEISRG